VTVFLKPFKNPRTFCSFGCGSKISYFRTARCYCS